MSGSGVFDRCATQAAVVALGLLMALFVRVGGADAYPFAGQSGLFAGGNNPHGVISFDLNGDGKLDLVAANAGSNTLAVLLGNGDGTFGSATTYPVGTTPKAVAIADLNGDGLPDAVTAEQGSSTISVLLGNGGGTFRSKVSYPTCAQAHESTIADLNGDGKKDIAVACWNGSVVSVLLGSGTGSFGAKRDFPSGLAPHSIVAADVNRDGNQDLLVANHDDSTVGYLRGNGNGTFAAPSAIAVGFHPHSLRVADLNADGKLDVATANDGGDSVSVLLGNGDGSFAGHVDYSVGSVPKGVLIADLNGDGKPDIAAVNTAGNFGGVTGNPGGDTVSVLLGIGDGTFQSQSRYPTGPAPFAVTAGDFDGDGIVDLATANYGGNTVSVLSGTPKPVPGGFRDSIVLRGLTLPTAVRFASDGRIFVAQKSGRILVYQSLSDTSPVLFADLSANVDDYWDRGLLGFALDPGFPTKPYVYVSYTYDAPIGGTAPVWNDACPTPPGPTTNGCVVSGRVSRLQANGNVMTGSEKVLVNDWCQQFPSHSMGALAFGADGALYASGGEGSNFLAVDYGQFGSPSNPCGDPPSGVSGLQTPPSAAGGGLRAQSLQLAPSQARLSGTIIRIDPATGDALPDNPNAFTSSANARRVIAYGLRNPFRFAIKPGTNQIYSGDVGWDTFEEIDVASPAAVKNFGWPCYEGPNRQPAYEAANLTLCQNLYANPTQVTAPLTSYPTHATASASEPCTPGSSSISGVAFYGTGAYPSRYDGSLFYADYSRNCIWALIGGDPQRRESFGVGVAHPVDLVSGPGGDLFYVDFDGGTIHRIEFGKTGTVSDGTNYVSDLTPIGAPVNGYGPFERDTSNGEQAAGDGHVLTLNGTSYAKGLGVHAASDLRYAIAPGCTTFTASIGLDDEIDSNGSLNFQVLVDGVVKYDSGVMTGSTATKQISVPLAGGTELGLLAIPGASPNFDHADWADAKIVCGGASNTAPTPTIATPSVSTTWRVGDKISFSGSATDPQDGPLPASALSWRLVINHCPTTCHAHDIQTWPGVLSGSFTAPDHEYPSDLELQLTATDADGLTATTSVHLQPQTVQLTLQSSPSGLRLAAGSIVQTTPFTTTVIVGSTTTVSAPAPQTLGGQSYAFNAWSDGGTQTHSITATAAPATYAATFTAATDVTAPVVVSRSPVAGASGVATSGSVSATFSEALAAASVSGSSFTLTRQGGAQVAASVSYDAANSRVVLAPSAELAAGSTYVARLVGGAGGILDVAGNALAADDSWSFTTAASAGSATYLSGLTPSSAVNGWGPYEKDMSNGEQAGGDGRTLTLAGVTFAKGLGVHAASDLRYVVPSGCSAFTASVGVDDEVGTNGSVVFQVLADGAVVFDSGVMTGASATRQVSVSLAGVAQLRLVVGGNGVVDYDHADWADAKLACGATDVTAPVVVSRSPVAGASGVATSGSVSATFSEALAAASVSGSSFTLTRQGGAQVAASVSYDAANSRVVLAPSAELAAGSTYVARLVGGAGGILDVAGNALAADDSWSFTTAASAGSATYLSGLTPSSAVNGWGPYEKDMSNGEQAGGDGRTLTLAGVTFAKGLGVHAASDLRYVVPSGCSAFTASVGVDDEVGTNGSVVFQVLADGAVVFDSGVMTGASATRQVSVSLAGVAQLRLVVGGNGVVDYDHADWADAKLAC